MSFFDQENLASLGPRLLNALDRNGDTLVSWNDEFLPHLQVQTATLFTQYLELLRDSKTEPERVADMEAAGTQVPVINHPELVRLQGADGQ
jgi:hypothetical protein